MRKPRSFFVLAAAAAALILSLSAGTQVKAAGTATLNSALIQGNQVVVTGSSSVASEDGVLHLYAQDPYESGTQGVEVAQAPNGTASFSFPLNKNSAGSNLFKKFTVVAIQNGVPTAVSNSVYITNPEASAGHTAARRDGGIKGILPASQLLNAGYLSDLGVHQATYNLFLGRITNGGGIDYQYNGKTYHFNAQVVSEYDTVARRLNAQGIQVTFIVLNDLGADPTLIHPLARDGVAANYYALNAADPAGVEKLAAVASFLGQRYSDTGHGTVDNWIIGNEVNARQMWNYMQSSDVSQYAAEYAKAFRVMYNGIRSENANAQVYVATDQQWAVASDPSRYYGSRPFLAAFNDYIRAEGNIDWRLSSHPYNVPLYDPNNWTPTGNATHSQSSRYVTMQNIDVITDFLSQPELLSPSGNVRSLKLSEVGYTSSAGEDQQAIAVTYAYLQAVNNRYVDGLIISREMDEAVEIAQGMAVGLLNESAQPKMAYDFYKHAGDPNYVAQASAMAGVDLTSRITVR
ncbi:MAG TPA: hypothetical protein H9717_05810 [Candidatus Eisenbergiella merdipullorum]|uniref:DUF5722 domain-containing protein n=1 Tax=Candidatus Eisenbergiella merdipullorum TaxID=2838553 RepID=A0A9D2I3J0_9FIRM|nr:hypothetical protein [Candidatus Eisenbergiella merdipullorum]